MSYYDAFKDAERKKVSVDLKTEWDVGEVLIGKLIDIREVVFPAKNGMIESTVNGYIFDTDEGLIQTTLGASIDLQQERSNILITGNVYEIIFIGEKDISGGKRLKQFNISELII